MDQQPTEEELKVIAANLRQPSGEPGIAIGEAMNEGNGPMNLHTLAVLNPQANDRILEIGMGNGHFVRNILLLDPSIRYIGCDFSETMVAESQQRNQQFLEDGRAQFHLANASKLPLDDASVNKIFTINTVYFWDEPEAILTELHRVLSDDGQLIISFRPPEIMAQYPVTQWGFTPRSRSEVQTLLADNKFTPTNATEVSEPDQEAWGRTFERKSIMVVAQKRTAAG